MIRRALTTLALTALVAAPAVAQSPWQTNFRFDNYGGSGGTYDKYTGQFSNTLNFSSAEVFQVFCVDPFKHVADPQTYKNAWVTPLSSSNSTHTQNYTSQWNAQYLEAARIATGITSTPTPGAGSGLSANTVRDYQYAIWTAMGFDVSAMAGFNLGTVNAIRAAAASVVIYPNQWLVITDNGKKYQEFITFDPDRPQETVPEPATMTLLATGLAGMAAARRKKRNS